jgi:hypothetical protein
MRSATIFSLAAFRNIARYLETKRHSMKHIIKLERKKVKQPPNLSLEVFFCSPFPELVRFWCFLDFWMAIQYIILTLQRRASPYIAACKTPFLAVFKVSNLQNKIGIIAKNSNYNS